MLPALILTAVASAAGAASPSIWFGADDPQERAVKGRTPTDYMALFTGDGAWARDVRVLDFSMLFANRGSDQDLTTLIRFAAAHRIALEMAGLMLVSNGACGNHVEGYDSPRGVERAAQRIASLGGRLDYIAMDEPFYYGHVYWGPRGCQSPTREVAAQVALHVRQLRQIFPRIQIGDVEPIGSTPNFSWAAPLIEWFAAYREAAGEPLAFFHGDINWTRQNWPQDLQFAQRLSHNSGTRFGIIYDGSPDDPDSETWTAHAIGRARQIEQKFGIVPDDAGIVSWMLYPSRMLPPTAPGTLTSVLAAYANLHR